MSAEPASGREGGPDRPQTGQRIALVLGAGGARGLAHIGVIEALTARGYRIAAVGGSSMGALIGGIYAAGRLEVYRDWVCALERGDVLRLLDFGWGRPGLFKGERIIATLKDLVGEHRIEQLPLPYLAVATDMERQREVWLTRGPLFDAIRASIAIPMFLTPHRINGRDLVDGSLLAPVPIAATRMAQVDLVVAVDVNARVHAPPRNNAPPPPAEPAAVPPANEGVRARIAAYIDALTDRDKRGADRPVEPSPAQPGLLEQMSRALDTMQAQLTRLQLALDPPDVLVKVPHDACYFYEFWRARELIEVGRRAAEQALDEG